MNLEIVDKSLQFDGAPLFQGLSEGASFIEAPDGDGVFVRFAADKYASRHVFSLGEWNGVARWTACHRYEPFWMKPRTGTLGRDVPIESQYVLAETQSGDCILLVPIIEGAFRASLQGAQGEEVSEGALELVVESGDPGVVGKEFTTLFVAVGSDPFELLKYSARAVMSQMKTGRLREDKETPPFVDQFGWCTWDAFYQAVSHDKVREGLESFAAGGVQPKLLILDDGWLSKRYLPTGNEVLTDFAANEKFPGDLAPTVQMAKGEFAIETLLVWHSMVGYWGGVSDEDLPGYGVRAAKRRSSPGIQHYVPTYDDEWWGGMTHLVSPEHIYRFFHDFHRHLRRQGVDGVKVDVQAVLEGAAHGVGGRVEVMRAYHEALEGSVQTHFQGDLINCMSCANEMFYQSPASTLTRTSTDFWPDIPSSHGLHLWTNAQVSLWFGQFSHPDWDMFQSGHPMGAFHAAARAISGSPIYVSDKVGAHDFDLLKKLVLPDGTILRAQSIGLPTRDCLFTDPTQDTTLLKIWNINSIGTVLGVFNARYGSGEARIGTATDTLDIPSDEVAADESKAESSSGTDHVKAEEPHVPSEPIRGAVSPSDIPGIEGERFAVYAHHAREVRALRIEERWELTLAELQAEIFTLVPIESGFAPIGLSEMFNSGGAIQDLVVNEDGAIVWLQSGGTFAAWSERTPQQVLVARGDDAEGEIPFFYDVSSQLLTVEIPREASTLQLTIALAE
ncbi:MAG TPA: Sip1-related alpha-galactosidase [Abditibacteriaceae bacterium]|jgi:raffinose synthase